MLTRYFAATGVAAHLVVLAVLFAMSTTGGANLRQMLVSRGAALHGAAAEVRSAVERIGAAPDFTDLIELPNRFAYRAYDGALGPKLGYGEIRAVGPERPYKTLDAAVRAAKDGDIIELDPGTYLGATAVIVKNDIVVRGRGGIATLDAQRGKLPEEKAILVIRGGNVLVENIEFVNAESRDHNGSGIRAEGTSLLVRNCYFHDNQEGILTIANLTAELVVEDSEFARNGWVDGQAHQIYVGRLDRFVFRRNYVHGTVVGSAIKSRAKANHIEYNFIADGRDGSGNYHIDLTDGGLAYVVGNVLEKAKDANNGVFVSYGAESMSWRNNALYMAHNTLVNDRFDGIFINNHSKVPLEARNNLFVGHANMTEGGPVQFVGNVVMGNSALPPAANTDLDGVPGSADNRVVRDISVVDRSRLDYRLTAQSPAIDAGQALPDLPGVNLTPQWEHRVPAGPAARTQSGAAMDSGAFEFHGDTKSAP